MSVEEAKKKAASQAVDDYVKDNMIVGLGSGSTVVYAAQRLAERVKKEGLRIKCVPTSFQSYQLCVEYGLTLTSLDVNPVLDVDIDGADEIDAQLNLIKGGGGCHVQEKIVASCAKKLVIIADYRKKAQTLGQAWKKGVPVEVIPLGYVPVMKKLAAMGGKAKLRMAVAKAGPVISDNGNFIIDVDFREIRDPKTLDHQIKMLPGVVDTGFFIEMAERAYIGEEDGKVTILDRKVRK
jgi:ribose 5-phosphate isomerase A